MIYRILEVKLDRKQIHLTANQIIKTLKNMNVTNIDEIVYKSLYENSYSLQALMNVISINLDHEYYLKSTLEKLTK